MRGGVNNLVNSVVGFNAPYHVTTVLRNPAAAPTCECGKPATKLVRFIVLNGEGHELFNGLLSCEECARMMQEEDARTAIEEIVELRQILLAQTAIHTARAAEKRAQEHRRPYRRKTHA